MGGKGGDIYLYDGAHVTIKESANEGLDLVLVQADSYTLGANIEYAMVWNDDNYVADTNLTGNELNNWLVGGFGSNTISGGLGDDVIAGFGGDDLLLGGTGSDKFVWSQLGYEGVIADFTSLTSTSSASKDKIWLGFSPVDEGAKGSKALVYDLSHLSDAASANGTQFTLNSAPDSMDMMQAQVIYDQSTGLLQIDIPVWNMTTDRWSARDGQADAQMFVNADDKGAVPVLSANDFYISQDTTKDWSHHPMT
jgi:Ca2+-binding RTX toxin-like protein